MLGTKQGHGSPLHQGLIAQLVGLRRIVEAKEEEERKTVDLLPQRKY
jgi:hypothetical protein